MHTNQGRSATCTAALLVWALLGTVPVAAQDSKLAATDEPIVRINIYPGSIINLPIWVMEDQGFCAARHIKCEAVGIPGAPVALQALVAGSLEVNFLATDVAMQSVSRGNRVKIIALEAPNNIFTLNVRRDVAMPHLKDGYPAVMQDFKGLRISVTGRGAATEVMTRALLLGAGVPEDSVTFVVGAPATAYPMMVEKQIDAAMMIEPFTTICKIMSVCVTAVSLPNGQGPPDLRALNGAFLVFLATDDFIAAHTNTVESFVQAMSDAVAWTKTPANFERVLEIAKTHMTLGNVANPDALLNELVKGEVPSLGIHVDRKAVGAFSDFLMKYKMIDNPVSVRTIVWDHAP